MDSFGPCCVHLAPWAILGDSFELCWAFGPSPFNHPSDRGSFNHPSDRGPFNHLSDRGPFDHPADRGPFSPLLMEAHSHVTKLSTQTRLSTYLQDFKQTPIHNAFCKLYFQLSFNLPTRLQQTIIRKPDRRLYVRLSYGTVNQLIRH